jgi:hypothetical protein
MMTCQLCVSPHTVGEGVAEGEGGELELVPTSEGGAGFIIFNRCWSMIMSDIQAGFTALSRVKPRIAVSIEQGAPSDPNDNVT